MPTWRNWQTRTVQVRVPQGLRVRLPSSVPKILRVWHNGCAPAFQAGYRGSTPLTRSKFTLGGIAERSKAADCKSALSEFDGSNPSPTTILKKQRISFEMRFLFEMWRRSRLKGVVMRSSTESNHLVRHCAAMCASVARAIHLPPPS